MNAPAPRKPRVITRETFAVTPSRLAAEFTGRLSLKAWLDPDANALQRQFARFGNSASRPSMSAKGEMTNLLFDACWRETAAKAFLNNLDADRALQVEIDELSRFPPSKLRDELLELGCYAQPVPAPYLQSLNPPEDNMQWCVYLLPALRRMTETCETDLSTLATRGPTQAELQSRKYALLRPIRKMPPLLVLSSPQGYPARHTLLEGRLRASRANEQGFDTLPAYEVTWSKLMPFLHQQPIAGRSSQLAAQ